MDAIDPNQNATLARKRIHSQSRQKTEQLWTVNFSLSVPRAKSSPIKAKNVVHDNPRIKPVEKHVLAEREHKTRKDWVLMP